MPAPRRLSKENDFKETVTFDAQCLKRPIDKEAKVIMVLVCSKAPRDLKKGIATGTLRKKPGYSNKTKMKP